MNLTLNQPATPDTRREAALVQAARTGDDRAFEELYGLYQPRIQAFILSRVRDHGRAEDIAQEVFMAALRQLRATDHPILFKPWLYTIARNACIDEFRRTGRSREVPIESEESIAAGGPGQRWLASVPTPDAAVESKQQLDDLRGAFGGLSDSQHRLLVMREFEGLSYDEIGDRLGMNRAMVESGLFRARRKLGEEYDELASGRRCEQIQTAIGAGRLATVRGLGIKERRRCARHLSHCQPCRHLAMLAGVDDRLLTRRSLADRVAALLPFGLLRRLWPFGHSGGSTAAKAGATHAAGGGAGAAAGGGAAGAAAAGAGAAGAAGSGIGAGQAAALAIAALAGAGGGYAVVHTSPSTRPAAPAGHVAPAARAVHAGVPGGHGSVGGGHSGGGGHHGGGGGRGHGAGGHGGGGAGGSGSHAGAVVPVAGTHRTRRLPAPTADPIDRRTTGAGTVATAPETTTTAPGSTTTGGSPTTRSTSTPTSTPTTTTTRSTPVTNPVKTVTVTTPTIATPVTTVETIVTTTLQGVGTGVQTTLNGVSTGVSTTLQGVSTGVSTVLTGVTNGVDTTLEGVTSGNPTQVGQGVQTTVNGVAQGAGATAGGVATGVATTLQGVTGGVGTLLGGG